MSLKTDHNNIDPDLLPKHVAVIMDGNGRWAKSRSKPRIFGHKAGVESVRKTIAEASILGIQVLTIFAFSSENWRRPQEEVTLLMDLFATVLGIEVRRLHKRNVKLNVIGDVSRFSRSLQNKIAKAEALTAQNTGLVLNVAANYGGQWDIYQSVQKVIHDIANGEREVDSFSIEDISRGLVTADQPDVDLLIRTSGECRISNFLLWQAAYAELYFTEQLWPDFDEQSFRRAIAWFIGRERRFGYTTEQINTMLEIEK